MLPWRRTWVSSCSAAAVSRTLLRLFWRSLLTPPRVSFDRCEFLVGSRLRWLKVLVVLGRGMDPVDRFSLARCAMTRRPHHGGPWRCRDRMGLPPMARALRAALPCGGRRPPKASPPWCPELAEVLRWRVSAARNHRSTIVRASCSAWSLRTIMQTVVMASQQDASLVETTSIQGEDPLWTGKL